MATTKKISAESTEKQMKSWDETGNDFENKIVLSLDRKMGQVGDEVT